MLSVMAQDVLLFARMRELIGSERVRLDEPCRTVGEAWALLCTRFPEIAPFEGRLLFSVNQEFADLQTPLKEGDELAIFPPVSGGEMPAAYPGNEKGDVFEIVQEPLRMEHLVNQLSRPEDGAVAAFSGIVRNHTKGRRTVYLEYHAYESMAVRKLREIGDQIRSRWDVGRVGIVHRLGHLKIGESSVLIVVTSPHRGAAFQACQYAIDTLKKSVPIWKKEFFSDGAIWVEGELPPDSPRSPSE
ncbi:MAG: molybdenum cofactor biosynthesis protein MoaE [Acidobacteriota bacterium]